MNLSLSQKDGITVLTVTGPMDVKNVQILKAGITKLFKDGKNRIALELKDAQALPPEVITEVQNLDKFAKELAGSIVVICASTELKKTIETVSESAPPPIAVFATMEPALKALLKSGSDGVSASAAADPVALSAEIAAKDKEIEALKNQVSVLDPKEITALRAESEDLKTKLREMEEHVKKLMLERRVPPDAEAYNAKIEALNDTIAELTEKIAAAAPKKG